MKFFRKSFRRIFLLEKGERRWAKIDVFEVWPESNGMKSFPPELSRGYGLNLSAHPRLEANADSTVTVLTISRGRGLPSTVGSMRLRELEAHAWNQRDFAEGIAVVVPGSLVLCWNHEGYACLWAR